MYIYTPNKKALYAALIILLSSCSSPISTKQINLIDKNIANIQSEVKEAKNNINKTKDSIKTLKQYKQVNNNCDKDINITNIINKMDERVEILDIQMDSIGNSLSSIKEQIEISKNIIKTEIIEYKNKYLKYKTFTYLLMLLFLLILINYIKSNLIANLKNNLS